MDIKTDRDLYTSNSEYVHIFGVRHHSPAAAMHLLNFLQDVKPKLILIEGPSDFNELIKDMMSEDITPPMAVMSYTLEAPINTVLYPFSVYSPEYRAICFARDFGCRCEFFDLPSSISLSLEKREKEDDESGKKSIKGEVYKKLDESSLDNDDETFWERVMEQSKDYKAYMQGSYIYGNSLRELTLGDGKEDAYNMVREAYMRRVIDSHIKSGTAAKDIVVIVGAYHIAGITPDLEPMSEKELKGLKRTEIKKTIMPYSYFRLSERSGYGAGNHAPAYYELLWEALLKGDVEHHAFSYLSRLAESYRESGGQVSSAQVIEAVELSYNLATLHDSRIPTLKDLRDAAVTCMAEGSFANLAIACAKVEIGTKIGSIPEGLSQTSIQSDFYAELKRLKLDKYKSVTSQELRLDLRENIKVKSESLAFMDLERSFFLHRLKTLGIDFAILKGNKQEKATWSEEWILRWTPEAEIQIVEAVLKGDTIEQALAFLLKEKLSNVSDIKEVMSVIEAAYYCGMPNALSRAVETLQGIAVDVAAIVDIADTLYRISNILSYGDIRKLDRKPLEPIVSQLFLRSCLLLPGECVCDEAASVEIAKAIILLHEVSVKQEFLDISRWHRTLEEISKRDDLNTKLSGIATAILIELSKIGDEEISVEMQRRLSKGVPADLGANWFEGLAMKNRYSLIARLSIWRQLGEYIDSLDDEEFKRALVSLRRAFADFDPAQKQSIAENLAEIWNLNALSVAEALSATLNEEEAEKLSELAEFDFDDI